MHVMERGMYYAYGALALWPLLDVVNRFAIVSAGANTLVYSFYNLIIGGICLVLVGWGSRINKDVWTSPYTWMYGLLQTLITVLVITAFLSISATEMGFLLRISAPVIALLYILLRWQKPSWTDFFGMILFGIGFIWMIVELPNGFLNPGLHFTILAGLCHVGQAIIAEKHPNGLRLNSVRDKCYFTGVILTVCSVIFLILTVILSFMPINWEIILPGDLLAVIMPSPSDFVHIPTIAIAFLVGVTLRVAVTYLYLNSARTLKADNLTIIFAVAPFAALGYESIAGFIGVLPVDTLDGMDVLAGLFISLGAVFTVFLRFVRKVEQDRPKEWFEKELEEIEELEAERMKQGDPVTKVN